MACARFLGSFHTRLRCVAVYALEAFFFGIGPRVFTATEQFVYGARKVLKCTTTERETATEYSETGHAYTLLRRRIANRLHLDQLRPLYLGHVI